MRFSIFNKYDSVYPLTSLSIEEMCDLITLKTKLTDVCGKTDPDYDHLNAWPYQVKKFRATRADEDKIVLPGITFGGDMIDRTNPRRMSGLFCIDIDNKHGENPVLTNMGIGMTKQYIGCLGSCVLAFVSPSGAGIKAVHRFTLVGDQVEVREAYNQVFRFYDGMYKSIDLTIDRACKDPYRFCFISYDREAFFDAGACTDTISVVAPPPPKPVVPCKDEDVNDKFARAEERVRTVKGVDWAPGKKHLYLVTLAGMCKSFGIDEHTFNQVASHYIIDARAVKSVKEIYSKNR